MAKKVKPPCIVMVNLILPSIRAIVVRKLVDEYGLSRAEAAKRAQLTRAAVTQYYKGVRGSPDLKMLENFKPSKLLISEMVRDLATGQNNILDTILKLCELCRILRQKRLLCKYCKEVMPEIDISKCSLCLPVG